MSPRLSRVVEALGSAAILLRGALPSTVLDGLKYWTQLRVVQQLGQPAFMSNTTATLTPAASEEINATLHAALAYLEAATVARQRSGLPPDQWLDTFLQFDGRAAQETVEHAFNLAAMTLARNEAAPTHGLHT